MKLRMSEAVCVYSRANFTRICVTMLNDGWFVIFATRCFVHGSI